MIERKKKTVEGRLVRHTITDGYADFGSQAYAPLTRIGVFRDRNSEQYVVKNKYLANYAGWYVLLVYIDAPTIPKSLLLGDRLNLEHLWKSRPVKRKPKVIVITVLSNVVFIYSK